MILQYSFYLVISKSKVFCQGGCKGLVEVRRVIPRWSPKVWEGLARVRVLLSTHFRVILTWVPMTEVA